MCLSDCQTVETMDPKEMGISPGILSWENKKVLSEGELVSSEETSHCSTTCQTPQRTRLKPRQ